MTLPTSGPLSLDDINVELGRSPNALISLFSATTGVYAAINTCSIPFPDGTAPYAISDWYGYNHLAPCLNSYYAMTDGGTSTSQDMLYSNTLSYDTSVSTAKPSPSSEFSFSFWLKRPNNQSVQGYIFGLSNTDYQLFISWSSLFDSGTSTYVNRINLTYNDYTPTISYFASSVNLSDATNQSITGVQDNAEWNDSNQGNVDANGYSLITIVVDIANWTNNGYVNWYWNDQLLDIAWGSSGTTSSFTIGDNISGGNAPSWAGSTMYIGGSVPSELSSGCQLDGFAFFVETALSPANVTSIYNSGQVAPLLDYTGVTTSVLFYNFELDGDTLSTGLGVETGGLYDFDLDKFNNPQRIQDPEN